MMPQQTPVQRQAEPSLDLNGCILEFVTSLFKPTFTQIRRVYGAMLFAGAPTVLQKRWTVGKCTKFDVCCRERPEEGWLRLIW